MASNKTTETTLRKSNLATNPTPLLETEPEVREAVLKRNIGYFEFDDSPLLSPEQTMIPTKLVYEPEADPDTAIILVGYPLCGVQQTVAQVTLADKAIIDLERVGTYAEGKCGAYIVRTVKDLDEPKPEKKKPAPKSHPSVKKIEPPAEGGMTLADMAEEDR